MPRARKPSKPTGYYWPCSFNNPMHKDLPLALPIMKGETFHFTRCQCGQNLFFPPGWPSERGLDEGQVRGMGLNIITNVSEFARKGPPKAPSKEKVK